MGYIEAKEDGIRIAGTHKVTDITWFFPLCHICGNEVKSMRYDRGVEYTCKDCKTLQYMSDKLIKEEEDNYKKEQKLDKAIKRIEKQAPTKIKEYNKAIEIVKKNLNKDRWFDSTEEIMVALELLRRKIKVKHQVKMGIYRLDFVLPDEKIVLEVDGTIFHTERTKEKEDVRDNVIILNLGPSWEVVRITDELINQNIRRLLPAIRAVRDKRQKIRKANNGMLPDWYSKRN